MAIGSNEVPNQGVLAPVIGLILGVVVLVIIYMIVPSIAGQVSQAMGSPFTGMTGAAGNATLTNPWNTSNASNNIPNGLSLWITVTGMAAVIVVVISATFILRYIMSL